LLAWFVNDSPLSKGFNVYFAMTRRAGCPCFEAAVGFRNTLPSRGLNSIYCITSYMRHSAVAGANTLQLAPVDLAIEYRISNRKADLE
jgi:hypothetical protein